MLYYLAVYCTILHQLILVSFRTLQFYFKEDSRCPCPLFQKNVWFNAGFWFWLADNQSWAKKWWGFAKMALLFALVQAVLFLIFTTFYSPSVDIRFPFTESSFPEIPVGGKYNLRFCTGLYFQTGRLTGCMVPQTWNVASVSKNKKLSSKH